MEIDMKKKTWKYGEKDGKIGDHFKDPCDIWHNNRYGVIGVYDPTDIEQLNSMIRDAQEAVSDRNYGVWD
jgi:hypothetical protein